MADVYAEQFLDELDQKPEDRELLERFAAAVPPGAPVCDVGCGPGHVGEFLSNHGPTVLGLDLSPAMLRTARTAFPGHKGVAGSMLALPFGPDSLHGIVAFYSLIHLVRAQAPLALQEFARVLRPGAPLLLSVHGGAGEIQVEEMLGVPVPMFATFYSRDELVGYTRQAGFRIAEAHSRAPLPTQYQSERIYVLAHREGHFG